MDPCRRVSLFQIGGPRQSTSMDPQQQQHHHHHRHQQQFKYPNENFVVTSMPVVQTILTNMPVGSQQPSFLSITPSTSSTVSNVRASPNQLNDREMNRRIKKQKMERRRRATIADKLTTLHSLVVSLVGDNESQSNQKTEISEKLDQCVNVMKVLTEVVKENPNLKARIQRPGMLFLNPSERNRRHGRTHDLASTSKEEAKENVPPSPLPSDFSLDPPNRSSVLTTSTPLVLHGVKRESTDSGLEQSQPSTSNSPLLSSSSRISNAHEVRLAKRSRESSPPKIWRPYSE